MKLLSDIDSYEMLKKKLVAYCLVLGLPCLLFFVFRDMAKGDTPEAALDLALFVTLTVLFWLLRTARKPVLVYRTGLFVITVHFLYHLYAGQDSGASAMMSFIIPLSSIALLGKREGSVWAFSYLIPSSIFIVLPDASGSYVYHADFRIYFLVIYALVAVFSYGLEYSREEYFARIQEDLAEKRENALFIEQLINTIPSPIFYKDEKARYLGCNKSFEEFIGISFDELKGKSVYDISPKDLADKYHEMDQVLFDSPGTQQYESSVKTSDKGRLNVIFNKATFTKADGSLGGLIGIITDVTQLKQNETRLKQALADKDLLMKEVHHRVKNNLNVIQSLLSLQSSHIPDAQTKGIFNESKNRVRSMSMIHDRLYRAPDLSTIDFSEYIGSLTRDIFSNYRVGESKVTLEMNLPKLYLDVDKVIPCGLITNELVTNALKHAFPEGREGTLYVGIDADTTPGRIMLVIKDNGVGLPDDFDINTTRSLGMQIVSSLSEQIGREIEIVRNNGSGFRVFLKEVTLSSYEWDGEIYGSFITEIDNDHRNLIDLLNQLKIDIESGKQEESVKELIPKLMDYAVNHFNTEEKYMVQYDYPGTDVHKAEHEKFVKEVSDTITALEAGKTVLFYEVYEFLSYWVDRHITEIDREMLDYLREKITTDK